ncbi:M20/M25/M40 family metallo-hydrolase [Ruminiclostridium herbifermentans]|uniref:M20/M25/M40 family metallo-hydrolase n=1 Tax=Ruminiclostridium herbifermentans TaxID=2488810 RepID=A0A7H1VS67_9FIRM|nr:M20/M25/M40 family metallo-hydrolase [Ruminiclostridium herbifermentans]QNU68229.1 M20/M25/M40 family metallo-hydrolase [Ruminiclostridium herbifermentans]
MAEIKNTNCRIDILSAAEHLSRAIQYKTISYENTNKMDNLEFLKFRLFLEDTFPHVFKNLKIDIINKMSILLKWEGIGQNAGAILLMAHMDVASVEAGTENNWSYPPFSGKISKGYIWGRGALDMKSQLMGILEAIEELLKNNFTPQNTIYLAFGHDEEIGGSGGNAHIADYLKEKGVTLSAVLDEGGFILKNAVAGVTKPLAVIGIAEKGTTTLELTSFSTGGHSSMPPRHTAIGKLATAIYRLEKKQFRPKLDGAAKEFLNTIITQMPLIKRIVLKNTWLFKPLVLKILTNSKTTNALVRTTIAVTMIEGGIKENILPQKAKANINFRILPGETITSIKEKVEKIIGCDGIEVKIKENSFNPIEPSSSSSEEYRIISKVVKSVFKETIVAPYLTVGLTDSRYYKNIASQIYRFCPIEMSIGDLNTIHGVNEKISIEAYEKLIKFFYLLIKEF